MDRPAHINLVYNTTVLNVKIKVAFRSVDQKWYALGQSNFVNTSILCSCTFPCSSHVHKGIIRHVTARKVKKKLVVQLYSRSALIPTLMVPLLSVRVTYNNEITFSMFSRDPSMS